MSHLRPALVLLLLFTALTGLAYPFAVTGIGQALFPAQANGSLVVQDGRVVGSELIGQAFTSDRYLWPRPSATSAPDPADPSKTVDAPYNAAASTGSNLGPTSAKLADRLTASSEAWRGSGLAAAHSRRCRHHVRQRPRSAHLARPTRRRKRPGLPPLETFPRRRSGN